MATWITRRFAPAAILGLLVSTAIAPTAAYGDPVVAKVFQVTQPDGTSVDVRVWGDEFYRLVESMDGYSLVRDPATGATCYARLSADGNDLVSTGVPRALALTGPGAVGSSPWAFLLVARGDPERMAPAWYELLTAGGFFRQPVCESGVPVL